MLRKRISTIAIVAATLIAMGQSAALSQTTTRLPITLNWKFYGVHGCLFLAQDRGYFKERGLDITLDAGDGSANVVNRLASGAYEIGFGDIGALIRFNVQNPDKKVRAIYQDAPSDLAVVTLKSRNIGKPADLEGRTLGAPVGDAAFRMFPAFVNATKINANSIKWEHMAANLREAMLIQGKVDAITANEQTAWSNLSTAGIKNEDMVFIRFSEHGVNLINIGLMATDKIIRERPEIVRSVVAAANRGYQDCLANPEAALDALLKRDPLLKRDVERTRFLMNVTRMLRSPDVKEHGLGMFGKRELQDSIDIVAAAEKLPTKPTPDDIADMSFLPPAAERAVPKAVAERLLSK
jgi:NitT/TauT family transport system substrate-binding protein